MLQSRLTPVVKNLLIINGIVFLATSLIPAMNRFMGTYCALFQIEHPLFHSYQFFTYMFLHASLSHLFFNMFALWMFGQVFEYEVGSRRFLFYYLTCGVGAAFIQMIVASLTGEYYFSMVGASGAVMGLLLAFGVLHPNEPMFIFFIPVPIKAKWVVIGYAVIELLEGMHAGSQIAHFAHIGGMLWGLIILLYWKKKGTIYF
ncbi:MAG: rhomboid family intramembrane serine protease [Alistipes sp.]|nr:rhomboid family intramembrane serine protease [Candidatus Alistipes equi]